LRIPPARGHVEQASLRVACDLAAVVRDVRNAGHVLLVFAGSCDVAPGVLAGVADDRCGVVWIGQPPTLITWGANDEIFGLAGAEAYKRDLPNAEVHLLDTGHFALEEELEFIAHTMRRFLNDNISGARSRLDVSL